MPITETGRLALTNIDETGRRRLNGLLETGLKVITAAGGVTEWLAGISAGAATVSGIIKRLREISGLSGGSASVAGIVKRLREIVGITAGVGGVSGTAKILREIAGISAGVAVVTGQLLVGIFLAGIISGAAAISGIIKISKKIASAVAGIVSISGIVKILKKIAGTSIGGEPDVGSPAIDRTALLNGPYTFIFKNNPAKGTGLIRRIEIYMNNAGPVEIASFQNVGGNNFSTRGSSGSLSTNLGLNVFNAPGDFSPFPIGAGDYIGIYLPYNGGTPKIDRDYIGPGYWWQGGDHIPCTNETFTFLAGAIASLYAKITSVSGLLIVVTLLAGIISGIAAVSGAVKIFRKIAAAVLGESSVNGIVKISKKIAGTMPGLTILIGSLTQPWQRWKQKQESAMSFQMKEKPSTEYEKKEKPSTTFQKKEKGSASWTKKEKPSSTWSKK